MTGRRIEPRSATVPAVAQGAAPAHVALEQARRVRPSLSETMRLASGVITVLTLACGVIAVVVHTGFGPRLAGGSRSRSPGSQRDQT